LTIPNDLKTYNHKDREGLIKEMAKQLRVSEGDFFKDNAVLNWSQLKSMRESGLISFGSHTKTHQILTLLRKAQQKRELSDSKRIIEKHLKEKIYFVAYPNGDNNRQISKLAKESGFMAGFITDRFKSEENDLFALKRIPVVEKESQGT